jgi:hypothetical protein
MADEVRINGNLQSWGSISVKLDNERYHGFTKLSYGDSRERAKGYGMGRHHAPRGRTSGKYATEPVVLGGPKSTVQALRDALAAKSSSGTSYGDVEFEIVAQFIEPDDTPMTVELSRCVVTKDSSSHEEGPDPLVDELEIDTMLIRRNGKTLFDESEGSP